MKGRNREGDERAPQPDHGLVSTDSVSVFQVLRGWLLHDEVVVPRAAVFPPGQSEKKVDQQNTQDLLDSQDSATEAALCELGYPNGFGLRDIAATAPAAKVLKPGDMLISLNGTPIDSFDKLSTVLANAAAGHDGSASPSSGRARRSPSRSS